MNTEHHSRDHLLFAWGLPLKDTETLKYEVGLVIDGKRVDIEARIAKAALDLYKGDPTTIAVMELARASASYLLREGIDWEPDDIPWKAEVIFPREAPDKSGPHDITQDFLTWLRIHLDDSEGMKWDVTNQYGLTEFDFRIHFGDGSSFDASVVLDRSECRPPDEEIIRMACEDPFNEGHANPTSVDLPVPLDIDALTIVRNEFIRLYEERRNEIDSLYLFASRIHFHAARIITCDVDGFEIEVADGTVTLTVYGEMGGSASTCFHFEEVEHEVREDPSAHVRHLYGLAKQASLY